MSSKRQQQNDATASSRPSDTPTPPAVTKAALPPRRRRTLLLGLAVLPALMVIFGIVLTVSAMQYNRSLPVATGQVIDVIKKSDRPDGLECPVVEFVPEGATTPVRFVGKCEQDAANFGTRVPVTYDPKNPADTESPSRGYVVPVLFIVIGNLALAWVLAVLLRLRSPGRTSQPS